MSERCGESIDDVEPKTYLPCPDTEDQPSYRHCFARPMAPAELRSYGVPKQN